MYFELYCLRQNFRFGNTKYCSAKVESRSNLISHAPHMLGPTDNYTYAKVQNILRNEGRLITLKVNIGFLIMVTMFKIR